MTPESPATALDRHFADLMQRLAGNPGPELTLAASLVSHAQFEGKVCLPLTPVAVEANSKLSDFVRKLRSTAVVGAAGDLRPLIVDEFNRLYLRRYWDYEQFLANAILTRLRITSPDRSSDRLTN